jgi:GYF domain 2
VNPVSLLATLVEPGAADHWYVTDGATAVGPVTLELLGRGIDAGKVPLDGFVRHESWTGWRRLSDMVETAPEFDPRKTFRMGTAVPLAYVAAQAAANAAASQPGHGAAAPALSAAADLPEALLLLLADAVRACEADVALVHHVRDEGTVVVCSHGPRMYEALGRKTPPSDPALAAAKLGHTVMAEPAPAPAGRAIRSRLSRPELAVEGAFMVPIRPGGQLFAFVEIGRARAFRAKDVAAVEALVEALVAEVEAEGWDAEWIADEHVEPAS